MVTSQDEPMGKKDSMKEGLMSRRSPIEEGLTDKESSTDQQELMKKVGPMEKNGDRT